jgi:large subunit ribosomal protein L22
MNENKKFSSATTKYVRISPSKLEKLVAKIRGKSYRQALEVLKYIPQKAGTIIWQTLYSAISNGTNNLGMEKEKLIVHEAYVNQGPILKRMRARAKGRGFSIQKKMSHLTISISEI